MKTHIGGLLDQQRSKYIKLGKRDDEDDITESGGDGFGHFENNTCLESNESGYGSEDYTNDDTDDEDQLDDDSEVRDDGVLVEPIEGLA